MYRCYFRSRLPQTVYLPLALFLSVAAAVSSPGIEVAKILFGLIAAYLLVLQFRLWDDLESSEYDRQWHPDRVLARAPSHRPFVTLLAICFLLNAALLNHNSNGLFRLATFLVLCSLLLLYYHRPGIAAGSSSAGFHLLLIKYPVIVLVLSDAAKVTLAGLLLSMVVVYLCFCVYEALHDKRYWTAPAALRVLKIEMTGLVAPSLFFTGVLAGRRPAFALSYGLLTVAASGCLIWLHHCHRDSDRSSHWNYLVFVIGFLQLVGLSLGNKI